MIIKNQATGVTLASGFEGLVFYEPKNETVHFNIHADTGGFLTVHITKDELVRLLKHAV